jgi:hypothetical protein
MAGRKLLYLLRRPVAAGHAAGLLPGEGSVSSEDDISVVLLDAAVVEAGPLPGRTFVLSEGRDRVEVRRGAQPISYADLVKLVVQADSTIVL